MMCVIAKDMPVQAAPVIQVREGQPMMDQGDQHMPVREGLVITVLVAVSTVVLEGQPTTDPGDHGMTDREDLHTAVLEGRPMTDQVGHVTQVPEVHAIPVLEAQASYAHKFAARIH